MKLAFSTAACAGWELSRIVETARRLRFAGIELAGFDETGDHTASLLHSAEAMRTLLAPAGLEICSLATSICLHHRDERAWRRAREGLLHALGIAREAGASVVQVFGHSVPSGESRGEVMARIAGRLREMAEAAGDSPRPIAVAVQNAGSFGRARELWTLLEMAGNPKNAGVCWDAGEATVVGADGAAVGDAPGVAVPTLNSRIRLARVWDHDGGRQLRGMGEGVVPVKGFVEKLRGIGYSGWVVYGPSVAGGDAEGLLAQAGQVLAMLSPLLKEMDHDY